MIDRSSESGSTVIGSSLHGALRLTRKALRRFRYAVAPPPPPPAQLEMIWPAGSLDVPPMVLEAGFVLRTYTTADESAYFRLLARANLEPYSLDWWLPYLLPDGFFVVEEKSSGRMVATCFAAHHPTPRHPFGGQLGWLAADPEYAGRGLGYAATAAVTRRLVSAGYRRIYLTTDDVRLAAIRVYLKMGWLPLLYKDDMAERWKAVCGRVGQPFTAAAAITEDRCGRIPGP